MITEFAISELAANDLHPELLRHFNRYQEVKRCWRIQDGRWTLQEIPFIEQWDEELKKEIVTYDFTDCLNNGGAVWGAFNENNELIAFASLLPHFFGSSNQYLQLTQIHVSYEYRGMGIGKKLFHLCSQKAKELGAEKLYISAHSSEETHRFYERIGCVDAEEINEKIASHEPYDRQMEFVL